MCYSAQIEASYARYVRLFGADIDIHEYVKLANRIQRQGLSAWKMPKAVAAAFGAADSEVERQVRDAIAVGLQEQRAAEQADGDAQRERLARAEAVLAGPKPTKKAADDKRIATRKIAASERRLADLLRDELVPADARMWPGSIVPVLAVIDGRRVVTPMRYRCRPYFVDEAFERARPGLYNARLDNLDGFWRPLFGHRHALVLVNAFFESVDRDGRATELRFEPNDGEPMLVPCLWSPWGDGEEQFQSFAIITDEPTSEILAAGHDRRPVQIRPSDVDAWLAPDPAKLDEQLEILLRGPRPYYRHALASDPDTA